MKDKYYSLVQSLKAYIEKYQPTMKSSIINFCKNTINSLESSENFARTFVEKKQQFFNAFQKPFIFSTRFGAEFFTEVLDCVINMKPLEADKGKVLGEYDKNFNQWLTKLK